MNFFSCKLRKYFFGTSPPPPPLSFLIVRPLPESSIPEGSGRNHYSSYYDSHSVRLPLIVFPAHFFFSMLFARSTQDKRHGSGRFFYLCNPFRGNVQILLQIAVPYPAQKLHSSARRMWRKGGSMQVFGRSKICKRGLSVNSSWYLFHHIDHW